MLCKIGCRSLAHALACSVSLWGVTPAFSFFDPVTASMAISLVQGGMSLGSHKPNVQLQAALASLESLKEVHRRLDGIENGLDTVLDLLTGFSNEMRKALKENEDHVRSENVSGIVATTYDYLDRLRSAKETRNREKEKEYLDILRKNILILQNERNSLFLRSDFVVPAISATMLAEIATARALGQDQVDLSHILDAYDKRFGETDDPTDKSKPSLAYMLDNLETEQNKAGREMQILVSGKDGLPTAGTYPWFAYVLTKKDRRKVWEMCSGIPSGNTDIPRDRPCPHWEEYDVPIYYKTATRELTLTKLEGTSDLFTLEVVRAGEEPLPWKDYKPEMKLPSFGSEAAAEKDARDNDRKLEAGIEPYKKRAEAIQNLRDLQSVVSLSRALIANWNSGTASLLSDALNRVGDAHEKLDALDQIDRDIKVQRARAMMDDRRKEAWAKLDEIDQRLQKAVAQAKANKWRDDLTMGLEVAQLSLKTYQLIDAMTGIPSRSGETGEAPQIHGSAAGGKPAGKTAAGEKPAPSAPSDQAMKPRPGDRLTAIADIRRDLAAGEKLAASDWQALPQWPVPHEAKLQKILALLDQLDASDARKSVPLPSDGERLSKGAQKALSGNLWETIGLALGPSAIGRGEGTSELDNWKERNALRKQALDQLIPYEIKRLEQARMPAPTIAPYLPKSPTVEQRRP